MEMTWEEKFEALQNIGCDVSLRMRTPGNWYVNLIGAEIGGDGFLSGACGNGKTPQEAVEDQWRKYTEIKPPAKYIVVNAMTDKRRCVVWAGYMWKEVKEQQS